MRLKNNELAKLNADLVRLEQQLYADKTEKDQLLRDVDLLTQDKEQLVYQVQDLEEELREKQDHKQQLKNQQKKLLHLEKQVAQKQEEWELQYQLLKQERDAAVAAAKQASQQLDVTSSELQMQKQHEQEIHVAIGEIVREQNAKLKCACIEVRSTHLTLQCNIA